MQMVGPAVNGRASKWTNVQLRPWKLGHFRLPDERNDAYVRPQLFPPGLDAGYVGRPFTTPEVPMSSFKPRMYPFLIAAVSVIAATGGAWRIG